MPEYAELHASAHLITNAARGHWFRSALVAQDKLLHTLSSTMTPLHGTEHWTTFRIAARHRGKEVTIALCSPECPVPESMGCETCSAVQQASWGNGPFPRCQRHGAIMTKRKVQRFGTNHGRTFFCCSREKRCGFVWFEDWNHTCSKAWWPPQTQLEDGEAVLVTVRRGMRGSLKLLDADAQLPASVQLVFVRDDGKLLVFTDPRQHR